MGLGAIVLCGGESRRMGRPKAWLPFGNERLLQRVVRLAGAVANPIVVVAAPGQELPALPPDVMVVRDAVAGRGPLQGLAAGLEALPDSVELAYVTGTDVPFLEPRWITRLVELIPGFDIVIPRIADYDHPLSSLYRRETVLPAVEALLADNRLRLTCLVDAVRTRFVAEADMKSVDPALDTLKNLNRPDEYQAALRQAGLMHEDDE